MQSAATSGGKTLIGQVLGTLLSYTFSFWWSLNASMGSNFECITYSPGEEINKSMQLAAVGQRGLKAGFK